MLYANTVCTVLPGVCPMMRLLRHPDFGDGVEQASNYGLFGLVSGMNCELRIIFTFVMDEKNQKKNDS